MSLSLKQAEKTIYSQEMPLSIKHSGWFLFQHQLSMVNPRTGKGFTTVKALSNTLKWMRQQKARQDALLKQLTVTEVKIMRLLVDQGLTQKQIALRFNRQEVTIKRHCTMIKQKLGVVSMYQAVAVAVKYGWVNPPPLDE